MFSTSSKNKFLPYFVRKISLTYLFYILLITAYHPIKAQISVGTGLSATDLINILQGEDIIILNETISCPTDAYGSYDNANGLNLSAGVLLTSGSINNALGPNTSASTSSNNNAAGSPLIDDITGVNTFDACVLEFDFIPIGNTFFFNYVFGSEEYFEYVCSGFNDGFGFFITGPNPAGGNFIDQNLAILPNGTPVSINSINNGNPIGTACTNSDGNACPCNSEFYIDNTGGTEIEYDGYTTVLEVSQSVVPCETYRIKIAIADGGDAALDSGILIENFSIRAINDFTVSTTPAYEGCTDGTVTFEINNPLANDMNISFNVLNSSTANPADYSNIPNSIQIPMGGTNASFSYSAILDNIDECIETIDLEYTYNLDCGLLTDTVTLQIIEGIAMTCPNGFTLDCSASLPIPDPNIVNLINECSDIENVTIVHLNDVSNNALGCVGDLKSVVRTYRATDTCGNNKDCTQIFTFTPDTEMPVAICPSDLDLVEGQTSPPPFANITEFINSGGTVSDNCNSNTELNLQFLGASFIGTGCTNDPIIFNYQYQISDICDNSTQCNQQFIFLEDDPLTLTCPANLTIDCLEDLPDAFNSLNQFLNAGGSVEENCGIQSFQLIEEIIE